MSSSKCLPPPGHAHPAQTPRKNVASPACFFIYIMGLLFFAWRFTLRMTYRKMLCPGPGCFHACHCFVLCSGAGCSPLPVLLSAVRAAGLGSVVSVEEAHSQGPGM